MSHNISSFIASKGLEAYRLMMPFDIVYYFQDSSVHKVMITKANERDVDIDLELDKTNPSKYRLSMVSDAHYKFWLALPLDKATPRVVFGECLGIKLDRVVLARPDIILSMRNCCLQRNIEKLSQLNSSKYGIKRPNRQELVPVFVAGEWWSLGPGIYDLDLCQRNPELERKYMYENINSKRPDENGVISYAVPRRMVMRNDLEKHPFQVLPKGRRLKAGGSKSKRRTKEVVRKIVSDVRIGIDVKGNLKKLHRLQGPIGSGVQEGGTLPQATTNKTELDKIELDRTESSSNRNLNRSNCITSIDYTQSRLVSSVLTTDSLYQEDVENLNSVEYPSSENNIHFPEESEDEDDAETEFDVNVEDPHDPATCGCI